MHSCYDNSILSKLFYFNKKLFLYPIIIYSIINRFSNFNYSFFSCPKDLYFDLPTFIVEVDLFPSMELNKES